MLNIWRVAGEVCRLKLITAYAPNFSERAREKQDKNPPENLGVIQGGTYVLEESGLRMLAGAGNLALAEVK